MKEYTMTYIWKILSLITLLPFGVICIGHFFEVAVEKRGIDTWIFGLLGCLSLILTVLIWIYFTIKKIKLFPDKLEVQTLFRKTSVLLDEDTKFIHYVTKPVPSELAANPYLGMVSGVLEGIAKGMSEEATTRIKMVVAHGHAKIRLTSNIRRITDLRDRLILLEKSVILPSLTKRYRDGHPLEFGPFTLKTDHLRFNNVDLPLNQLGAASFDNGKLILEERGGKPRPVAKVKTLNIPNMYSMLQIIAIQPMDRTFRFPRSYKLSRWAPFYFAFVALSIFAMLPFLSYINEHLFLLGVIPFIFFVSIPVSWYTFKILGGLDHYVNVNKTGITYGSRRNRRIILAWRDVSAVRKRSYPQALVLYGANGQKVMKLKHQLKDFNLLRYLIQENTPHLNGQETYSLV